MEQILGWVIVLFILLYSLISHAKKKKHPPSEEEKQQALIELKRHLGIEDEEEEELPPPPPPPRVAAPAPPKIKERTQERSFDFHASLETYQIKSDIEERHLHPTTEEAPSLVSTALSERFDLDPAYALKTAPTSSRIKRLITSRRTLRDYVLFSEILKRPYID